MFKGVRYRDHKEYHGDYRTEESQRKSQELSAKENNTGFVYGDAEDFISDYEDICKKLEG